MPAGSLRCDLHLPDVRSLKAKRATVRPILEGLRNRFHIAAAETAHQDVWDRAELTLAATSASVRHVTEILDECERFVWSFPEIEIVATWRGWVEEP